MFSREIRIGNAMVGPGHPCYFIAEIGSNFDGDLQRAKDLVKLAQDCGADAAKFQSFLPEKIIRAEGFDRPEAFQAKWERSVWDVYSDASFPRDWHAELVDYCSSIGISFFSSPYDDAAVDLLDGLGVPVHKIGSGEIDNLPFLRRVAQSGKPTLLGVGASTMAEVSTAIEVIEHAGCTELVVLQCITNYPSQFESAELRSMVTMAETFDVLVGYSDHTPGDVVPLGAVALGACVIEKHFTDDTSRPGPDHGFALDPPTFSAMVERTRHLEAALGTGRKRVMPEEERTRVFQRRGLWSARDLQAGATLTRDDVDVLRPATGLAPGALDTVVGMALRDDVRAGTALTLEHFRAR